MPLLSPRSYLFVPGSRPDRFAKACAAGADAVVIDLEDSVAAGDKPNARAAVAAWLTPAQPVLVRVNVGPSEWFGDDLKLGGKPGIIGVLLPKSERTEDIRAVTEHFGPAVPVLLQIETAQGFSNAQEMAGAKGVERLKFRSRIVLISRRAGIQSPVDGVTTDIHSTECVRADTLRARRLGFGGKMCIHP